MDVTSKYPFVICVLEYPIGKPNVPTWKSVFVIPEHDPVSAKITLTPTKMTGTWTSVEL